MIQKVDNIPFKIDIPNSKTNDGFRMLPNMIINQINKIFIYRKQQLDIDEKIEIENNRKIDYFIYYYNMYDIIKEDIYNLFNNKQFWRSNMHDRVCEHTITEGKYQGLFCGKRVDIKSTDKNGNWKCSKHISIKYYKPKHKKIPIDKLCISKIGYKNKQNCNMEMKYIITK
jgi:hypothetical protein